MLRGYLIADGKVLKGLKEIPVTGKNE